MTVDRATLAGIPGLAVRYRSGEFSAAEYAAIYVLVWQLACYGNCFALRRSRRDPKPDGAATLARFEELSSSERTVWLIDFLGRHDLRGVRRRVNVALIGWLKDEWRLSLCESVPGVREVLRMQILGTRPVTVIAGYPRLLEPVQEKSDAFSFVRHDLEHAWQFFRDPESHDAQRRFAQMLDRALEQGVFTPYVADPVFSEKLDYLAADMNTHVMHSLQYLRAILLDFHLRAEGKGPREQLSAESRAHLHRCLAGFDDNVGLGEDSLAVPGFAATAIRH
jgi:hypothetical protein